MILATRPATDPATVAELLEETSEAGAFRLRHGRLPLAGVEEVDPLLESLRASGGAAEPAEFRSILAVARAAEAVVRVLEKAKSPRLAARRERLPRFVSPLEDARRLFDADGAVRDDASPALAAARSRLRRRRAEISRQLERLLDQRRELLGDAVIVLRNDRYCLPVLASARGRVPGIVHDRSGSGQTVFIEPMEIIEPNNELALLAAEERREVERLLAEFGRAVLALAPALSNAVAELAALDALEAKVEFGEISEARIPELSSDGGWALAGARHPLLDPRVAPLRRRVLGEDRLAREVVPLDLELPAEKRLLVVSGPNAGGKTVVLKTAGLFSLLVQSGLPVPALPGTRLPVFSAIRTEIGDAQAILSDRSTFSSSMETLRSILDESGSATLALIDEIGGATDPEEGSALAVAWLEEYLARGGRAIVTTHLSGVKTFAASRPDSICAAMEFNETTGRPNYRLHPGLAGRSRAISVARDRGIPDSVLERAYEILGTGWRRREQMESEAEAALDRLRRSEEHLAEEGDQARRERERLALERERLTAERRRLQEEGLTAFERARRELTRRVERELSEIRQDAAHKAQQSAATLVAEAERTLPVEEAVEEARRLAAVQALALAPGAGARIRGARTAGVIRSIEGETAWVEASGKRLKVPLAELEPVKAPARPKKPTRIAPPASPEPVTAPTREVNVIGQRLEEAISEIEKRLDEALLNGAGRLRIIHGHGTGRLRDGVREHFRRYPGVAALRAAESQEGGNGATILELA